MKALILAAGQGTRLRPLTDGRPKCLVPLAGHSLLDYQLNVLNHAGITDITVISGYCAEQLDSKRYCRIMNEDFETTNMVHTLFCAADAFDGKNDLLICYGDIIYEPRVLAAVLASDAPVCLAVDKAWKNIWQLRMENPLDDAETLKLDPQGYVLEVGKKPKDYSEIQGQYMGLIKFRADIAPQVLAAYLALDRTRLYDGKTVETMFMTSFLQVLIDTGWRVKAAEVENGWLEVDTLEDLHRYDTMYQAGTLNSICNLDVMREQPRETLQK